MTFVRKRKNILRDLPINPYVNVLIDGKTWDPLGLVPGGWELCSPSNPAERKILFRHDFEDLQKAERVHIVDNVSSFSKRFNISPADRDTTVLRFFWATAVEDCIAEGLIRSTPKGRDFNAVIAAKTASVIAAFHAYRASDEFDHGAVKRKAYGGAVSPTRAQDPADVNPESLTYDPKTLKRHYDQWRESGDLWDLRPKPRGHDRGGRKPDPETVEFIKTHITFYASEIVNNVSGLHEYVNAFIEDANMVRGDQAKIPLASYYSIAQAIDEIPASRIYGGRRGKKAARQALRHVGAGPSYKRPGEMILFDCWATHVHVVLDKTVQALFSAEKNAQRIVLSVGFDSASDTFVALDASLTENSQLTHRTLRMAVSDKSAIAKEAGCNASWHMRLAAEEGKSDCGGAYRNQLFLSAAMTIFDRYTYAAAGRAHLRGKVERILRTMDTKFVRKYLTGGTRSNTAEKGEYNAEERAQIFIQDFLRMIICFIVDVYHYTAPTRGGLSSARKYDALMDRYQPKPLPNATEIRLAFGFTRLVQLNRAGLRFMDIQYYSSWLDPVLQNSGPTPFYIKVDPDDLGAISVLLGSDWTTVEGPREFRGVRLLDWIEEKRRLRRAYGEQARIDFRTVVAPAIVSLADRARLAREFFNIRDVEWTEKSLDELERELRTYVLYDRDPCGPETALMGDSRNIGTVHTRSPRAAETMPANMPGHATVADEADALPSSAPETSPTSVSPALTDPAEAPTPRPAPAHSEDPPPSTPSSTRRPRRHFSSK